MEKQRNKREKGIKIKKRDRSEDETRPLNIVISIENRLKRKQIRIQVIDLQRAGSFGSQVVFLLEPL